MTLWCNNVYRLAAVSYFAITFSIRTVSNRPHNSQSYRQPFRNFYKNPKTGNLTTLGNSRFPISQSLFRNHYFAITIFVSHDDQDNFFDLYRNRRNALIANLR